MDWIFDFLANYNFQSFEDRYIHTQDIFSIMFEYDEKALSSEETDVFVVGLGCFWGVESNFGSIDGVIRTSCGYSGGTKENPTYENIKDHTETVRVEYDSSEVSYKELVNVAINAHNLKTPNRKRQYDNVIFYNTDEQKRTVEQLVEDNGYSMGDIKTRIENRGSYYYAEDYHQKYRLRSRRTLEQQFTDQYTSEQFRDSALATKINSLVAGDLSREEFSIPSEFKMTDDIFDRIIKRFRWQQF